MDGEFRPQFSLKVAYAAMAGIAAFLALAHWTHIFVEMLAFAWFLAGLLLRIAGMHGHGIAFFAGLGLISLLTTLAGSVIPMIASPRGVLGAFAIAISFASPLIGPRWKRRVAALAVYFAWLLFLTRPEWDPRKPFWRFYCSIEHGMTQEQVDERLRRQFTGDLPARQQYVADQWHFCLDPNDGRYNSEIISIVFRRGRVAAVHYYPD